MARIQQSIDVNAPAHAAYDQLVHFDEYPRFMQGVDAVRQTDRTHLHWSAHRADRQVEWDAEITEQRPDRCIAWRNLNGPQNAGKVEVQPVGEECARVVFTMECDASQVVMAQEGNAEAALTQRLGQDLERLKILIETRGMDTNWSAEQAAGIQANATTQSDHSLSRSPDGQAESGQFRVAEEQNFDAQSEQARRVGQMPQDAGSAAVKPSKAMAKSMKPAEPGENQ